MSLCWSPHTTAAAFDVVSLSLGYTEVVHGDVVYVRTPSPGVPPVYL